MIGVGLCTSRSPSIRRPNGSLVNCSKPFPGTVPRGTYCGIGIRCYGERFSEAARWLGIQEVLTAPQSPWQNPYVERFIGSIRRECTDHVIVFNETGLRRILKSYFEYYERSRTHLSLGKDAPISRPIQPVGTGRIVEIPQVGGLHHRYERVAA